MTAACRSSDVLPTPEGPYTSVTFPRAYPPVTSWPGRLGGASSLSSCARPVGAVRAPRALRLWSACEAETVGSLSLLASVAVLSALRACTYARTEWEEARLCLPLRLIGDLRASPVTRSYITSCNTSNCCITVAYAIGQKRHVAAQVDASGARCHASKRTTAGNDSPKSLSPSAFKRQVNTSTASNPYR